MTRVINLIWISSLMLLLAACGGSSDTPATTDGGTHSLAKLHSTATGSIYLADITGSDSDEIAYSGEYETYNNNQFEFNGVMVTPRKESIVLQPSEGVGFRVTNSLLIDESGYVLAAGNGESWCQPAAPVRIPESVNIGDAATLPLFDCGSRLIEFSWNVEDAGDGNIQFMFSRSVQDAESDDVLQTKTALYTLDTTGNVLEFSGTFINIGGYTLDYSTNPDALSVNKVKKVPAPSLITPK